MSVPFFNRLPVRLAAMILLMGFIAVPIVSEIKRRAVERIVLGQAEAQAATATIAVVEGVQDVLRSAESSVRYLSRDLEGRTLSAADVDKITRNVISGNSVFTDCSVAFEPLAFDGKTEHFGRAVSRATGALLSQDIAAPNYEYWTKDWYQAALARGDMVWSEPFYDKGGSNVPVVRLSAPFFRTVNGERVIAGVISAGFDLRWVKQLVEENDFFDSGYVIIFSQAGRIIAHPNPAYVFNETMESLAAKTSVPEMASIHQRVLARHQGTLTYLSNVFQKRVHENYKPVHIAGWGVVVGYSESEFLQQISDFRWITTLSLAATLALLSLIVLYATKTSLDPLEGLTVVSDEIARGNLDCDIVRPSKDDEIGRLSKSFIVMRDVLKKNRALESEVKQKAQEIGLANEKLILENLERRWINQALEHQARYNQVIIDSMNDLVFVLTKAMNISRINPAVVRRTGFEPRELINSPLSLFVRLSEEALGSKQTLLDPLTQALREGHDLRDQAAVIQNKLGRLTPVRLTLFPLRDRDKVVGGVIILHELREPSPALS